MEVLTVPEMERLTDEAFEAMMDRVAAGAHILIVDEDEHRLAVLVPYEWYRELKDAS